MAIIKQDYGEMGGGGNWMTENPITESNFVGNTKSFQTKNAVFSAYDTTPMCGILVDGVLSVLVAGSYPTLVFASYDPTTNTLTFNGTYHYTVMYEPM